MRIIFWTAFALLPVFASAQEGMRATDRVLPVEEMQVLLSGQIVEFFDGSKSRYTPDGVYGYTYTDDGPVWGGTYSVVGPSEVCVDFDNGSARCDLIINDGNRWVLITSDGTRFPIRNITVDTTDG